MNKKSLQQGLIRSHFSADTPQSDTSKDAFKRNSFARHAARVIADRNDPASSVIAIYGAWGEGKTTVLEFVKHALVEYPKTIIFQFNPWRFGSDDQLLLSFFAGLAHVLQTGVKAKIKEVAGLFGEYAELVIPSIELEGASISPGANVAKLMNKLSAASLEDIRRRIEKKLAQLNGRILVIMDDIDRLEKTEIQQVFKLIKLTANFNHVDYLLAFDDTMVSSALNESYGGGPKEAGRKFLEKIIHVPLQLPAASPAALLEFCFSQVDEVLKDLSINPNEVESVNFAITFRETLSRNLTTPRDALRYANALRFDLPLVLDKVRLHDFLLLDAIRVLRPELYEFIRDNGWRFITGITSLEQERKAQKRLIDTLLESSKASGNDADMTLLQKLFPQISSVVSNHSFSSEFHSVWAKVRCLCTEEYFFNYFTFEFADDDFPDPYLEDLLRSDEEGIDQILRAKITPKNAVAFLQKARWRIDGLSEVGATALCRSLAKNGILFPETKQVFPRNPSMEAALLLSTALLKRISSDQRKDLAFELIKIAEPLSFAADCLLFFRPSENQSPSEAVLSGDQFEQAESELASRVRSKFEKCLPWEDSPNSFGALLSLWARVRSRKEVESRLKILLGAQPEAALQLIPGFCNVVFSTNSGPEGSLEFPDAKLESVSQVVDLDFLAESVERVLPREHASAEKLERRRLSGSEAAATQFLRAYKKFKDKGKLNPSD